MSLNHLQPFTYNLDKQWHKDKIALQFSLAPSNHLI